MQEERQPTPIKRSKWRTFGLVTFITVKWMVYFGIFIGLLAGGAVTGYVAALVKGEEVRPRTVIEEKVGENSITGYVYFNDDSLVGQLRTSEDRTIVTYEELPPQVINAVLGIEDNNFFEHKGVDIYGLGRAVKQKLLNEDIQTGGSTLTQQVARRVFLSLDKTDSRKFKEIFLSLRMERYLTKEEILTAYLNKVPFGNGSSGYNLFGIKAAAKGIFNITDLNQLNIAQSAYLAGLPQRPSAYTAFTGKGEFDQEGFDLAMGRQRTVLMRMLETGRITQQEYDEAMSFDIRKTLAPPTEKAYTTYPYLMLEAERQAAEIMIMQQDPTITKADLRKKENAPLIEEARDHLLRGGYHVYTTIDKKIYSLMREIGSNEDNFTPYSEKKGLEQIAAVMLDHKTGAIIGMLEGRDFYEEQLNYATQMTRQPGSTMKTLAAYLPAIEKGIIQPASIVDDAPIVMKDGQKGFHIPMNVTNKFAGLVTARDALNQSFNLPALKIFNDEVKIENAWEFVKSLGITTLQPEDSYAQTGVIGGLRIGVSVEEFTNAYGSIPNKGVLSDAYMIERITDANGKIVYEHKVEPKRVFTEQSAFLMTDMLTTVISDRKGSGHRLTSEFKHYGEVPIAGKTGTTQSYGDVWFMGFSPDVTLGVWAGYEEQVNSLTTDGRTRARKIWALIMDQAIEAKPELFATDKFERPKGIVKATVSSASGLLPSQLTKEAGMLVTDWFNQKYIPKKTDDALVKMAYISYQGVNYVPNPATPLDFIKEQTVIKRKKPLDALMDEIKAAQAKLPAGSRRPLSVYLPADADQDAPSKPDPRKDDGAAPPAPGSVKLQAADGGVLVLTFSDSSAKDVVGYRVYRSVNQGNYEKVGESIIAGEDNKAKFYVSSSQSYSYYVTAVDVAGKESAPSQPVAYGNVPVVPGLPDGGGSDGEGAPSAPAGVKAENTGLSIRLSWTPNAESEQVSQYHIYYSANDDGRYERVDSTSQPSYEYVAPLIKGAFFITSVNEHGESSPSEKITIN
ncbi:transglycosylase domain-containing protein [Paenibacillus arenilitoris]|uniref:Transglycosylase domain-containing protein n=1 Tax=Paenibacillus arenilitoris TaxID=2772299 RepID=A0A927H8E5_9BACL|nr:transglycosylase domain-containing protein [Paenibacillus arenilitoris]MBD2871487.1 transglycosylase domain-containing protein [Paenibacillus arenilitoris]